VTDAGSSIAAAAMQKKQRQPRLLRSSGPTLSWMQSGLGFELCWTTMQAKVGSTAPGRGCSVVNLNGGKLHLRSHSFVMCSCTRLAECCCFIVACCNCGVWHACPYACVVLPAAAVRAVRLPWHLKPSHPGRQHGCRRHYRLSLYVA
jgi:hypothetical protein